ncbi:hypothetical protein ABZ599_16000 [Streptomyces misionensis]|uniref:hypothetical protein n=1 Tax=Streptomyces misionensis TaxID=67331 RepID=UPI0033C0B61F
MQFPVTVIDQLDEPQLRKWHDFYGVHADRPRFEEEGIWRRTQQKETAANSGWKGAGDARRRIVHYRHQYGLVHTTVAPALALVEMYLYHSVAAPKEEIAVAWEENHAMLSEGGWKATGPSEYALGDLRVSMIRMEGGSSRSPTPRWQAPGGSTPRTCGEPVALGCGAYDGGIVSGDGANVSVGTLCGPHLGRSIAGAMTSCNAIS